MSRPHRQCTGFQRLHIFPDTCCFLGCFGFYPSHPSGSGFSLRFPGPAMHSVSFSLWEHCACTSSVVGTLRVAVTWPVCICRSSLPQAALEASVGTHRSRVLSPSCEGARFGLTRALSAPHLPCFPPRPHSHCSLLRSEEPRQVRGHLKPTSMAVGGCLCRSGAH